MKLLLRIIITLWLATMALIVCVERSQAQQPVYQGHKVTNTRIAPPAKVCVPFVTTIKGEIAITAYRIYKIRVLPKLGPNQLGYTEDSARCIRILANQPLEDEKIAVAHELMHAEITTDRSDEHTTLHNAIYLFSQAMPSLLSRNPELVRYLTQ